MELSEFYNQNKDLFDKVNNAILESEFTPVKEVYFDLSVLKDMRMGLMLSLAESSDDINRFKERLESYNNRPTRDFVSVYPEFQYSEEELQKMYRQPEYWDSMFNCSPDTELSQLFPQVIKSFFIQNERCGHFDKIKININTWPISTSDNIDLYKKLLNRYLSANAKCNFICREPKTLPEDFWQRQQYIFLDDIKEASEKGSGLVKPLFEDQTMLTTKIFAPYSTDKKVLEKWGKIDKDYLSNLNDFFSPTELVLQSICFFKFISCKIPTSN